MLTEETLFEMSASERGMHVNNDGLVCRKSKSSPFPGIQKFLSFPIQKFVKQTKSSSLYINRRLIQAPAARRYSRLIDQSMLRGQGLSPGTLTTYGNCGISAKIPCWTRQFKLEWKNPRLLSGFGIDMVSKCNSSNVTGKRSLRVEAGWLFSSNSGNQDSNSGARLEQSESVNEDILIFFFQLDLATRVQCALNMEQYDVAQQLRNKLTEVEQDIMKRRDSTRGTSSKSEAQDKAINMIRLRADLQNAIEKEDYALAAEFRDQISKLEKESLAVSAEALAYANVQYAFRLGQKVKHKIFGYRAVICGMDPVCCESSSWIEAAQIQKLDRGPNQPFYQVLVDVQEDPNLLVAYVAEDSLIAPDKPDLARFDHPYASFLFYGVDTAGDFIPVKQLREKFNRPRHEVPTDPPDENSGGSP